MTQYADYNYYQTTYLGGIITVLSDFNRAELRAHKYIDRLTFGNIDAETLVIYSDDIKMCVCALCEEIYKNPDMETIKSESVGEYSVTYGDSYNFTAKLYDTIKLYLADTGLLYRGTCK